MSKIQIAVIGFAVVLFLGLYLGIPIRPKERAQIDKSRALKAEEISTISAEQLLLAAKGSLQKQQLEPILQLEEQLENSDNDTQIEVLKNISKEWNKLNRFALGGFYAEKVANLVKTDTAWSITGTTYYTGFQQARDSITRDFCAQNAIKAFENAISLNPENSTHKVNLGLCFVNGSSNPMKGIMMIRDLVDKNPNDVLATVTLGKLSMRTKQYEKAISRFEAAIKSDPTNVDAHYWLGQAFIESGNTAKGKEQFEKCLTLSTDKVFNNKIKGLLKSL